MSAPTKRQVCQFTGEIAEADPSTLARAKVLGAVADWWEACNELRTSESTARAGSERLAEKVEELAEENAGLRLRVSELEGQIGVLQGELAAERGKR